MDRHSKERLIGAIVLVAAAWLLIPVFLDGPSRQDKADDVRELTLPQLDEQDSGPSSVKRQTVVLEEAGEPATPMRPLPEPVERDATEAEEAAPSGEDEPGVVVESQPAPAADGSSPAAQEPPPEQSAGVSGGSAGAAAEPDQTPPATSGRAAPAVAAGAQLWAVQIGSFSDKENADRLAADLRGAGYPAFLSQITADGRTLHRVRVGPQADQDASEAMQARLVADGYNGRPVRHP